MPSETSLVDLLERTRDSLDPITILDFERRESRTRADLLDEAAHVAGGLAEHGCRQGDRVAMAATTSFEFMVTVLGIWRIGGVVVPLPPELDPVRAGDIHEFFSGAIGTLDLDAVVTVENPPAAGGRIPLVRLQELSTGSKFSGAAPDPHDEALLQRSSGTTSAAKGVILTHAGITGYLSSREQRLNTFRPPGSPTVSWLPLYHDLGFVNHLLGGFVDGGELTLISPGMFVRRPLTWLREISEMSATTSSAPNFAYALSARALETEPSETFDLSSWSYAGMGGEPVQSRTVERFVAAADRHRFDPSALRPAYGLAEATCTVTIADRLRVDEVSRAEVAKGRAVRKGLGGITTEFVSVGLPLPGAQIRIVDGDGVGLPEREIGEVQVRSGFLMKCYAETGERSVDADGWLRTGDLGYVAEGDLFITGRLKDVLIVYGKNYHAEEIESVVGTVAGVKPGRCVAFGMPYEEADRLVVAFEPAEPTPNDTKELSSSIRRVVRDVFGLLPADVVPLTPGSIPKTSSGKLRRGKARRMYVENRWQRLVDASTSTGDAAHSSH